MSTFNLEEAFEQAIEHHSANELVAAEKIYHDILLRQPNHADTNYNLGVLYSHNPPEALPFFKTALEADKGNGQFWVSYIEMLIQTHQLDAAVAVLEEAIRDYGLQGDGMDELMQRLADLNPTHPFLSAWVSDSSRIEPSAFQINHLALLFNHGDYVNAEKQARDLIARYPEHGFSWKVLSAVLQAIGQLDQALTIQRKAIELLPNDAEAYNNLAVILYNLASFDEAEINFQRAITLDPNYATAYNYLALTVKELGRLNEAEKYYRQAIAINPNDADIYYNLALTFQELGRLQQAEESYRTAIKLNPNYAVAYYNLGIILQDTNRLEEAKNSYFQAIAIQPNTFQYHVNLGNVFKTLKQLDKAESHYRTAIELEPNYAEAYKGLGVVLQELGRLQEAKQNYQQVLAFNPNDADSYNNLGLISQELGDLEEAKNNYLTSIKIKPDNAESYLNLGNIFKELGKFDKAKDNYRAAINIRADYADAYLNLGNIFKDKGQFDKAESNYRSAIDINPNHEDAYSNLLLTYSYTGKYSAEFYLNEAKRYGEIVSNKVGKRYTTWQGQLQPKRLRIGLVSGDFRNHPVGHFLENILRYLQHSNVEIIAYSNAYETDEVTERLKAYFTEWKLIFALNDEAAAQVIHSDGVHILIDLSGHTAKERLAVFAWKPAPIQISWLGYWASTGVTEIDYILADKVGVPENKQWHFTEKVRYLPNTQLCFSAPKFDIPVTKLPALRNEQITFGCFQNLTKVTDEVLDLWGKIFAQLPTARFKFQSKQLADKKFTQQFYSRLAQYGIQADRVNTQGVTSRKNYLIAHSDVDLILDTFPFNGGTTTCEALWMGVPTLTLAGETLVARQGASLLAAAGLSDWIVYDKESYIEKAVKFAADLEGLAKLRSELRQQVLASPLFDGQRFARNFENTLWAIWQEHNQQLIIDGV